MDVTSATIAPTIKVQIIFNIAYCPLTLTRPLARYAGSPRWRGARETSTDEPQRAHRSSFRSRKRLPFTAHRLRLTARQLNARRVTHRTPPRHRAGGPVRSYRQHVTMFT